MLDVISEWLESQKKPSGNFRELLQKQINNANPCRKLNS